MSLSEIITDGGRRRGCGAAEKLRIVEETLDGRESISIVARRNGVAPNLLYRWRRLMLEGGSVAVTGDDNVTSNREVREMESRIRELERRLGRKTLEVEILKEALDRSRPKKATLLMRSPLPDAHTALASLAGWIEDYNEHHPHSGLKMRSPREHRAMGSTTA